MSSTFPGIIESLQNVSLGDINADLATEQEDSLAASVDDISLVDQAQDGRPAQDMTDLDRNVLRQQISKASNSTTERTQKEYEGLQKAFLIWLENSSYWPKNTAFFCDSPHPDSPDLIVAWIMSRCDNKDAKGNTIPASQPRQSYSYAMKMRAAMTHAFGHNHGLGKMKWHKDGAGIWRGNPSVSDTVSGYLVNLHRTKTRAGEASTSAKAIRPEVLKKIFDFNNENGRSVPTPYIAAQKKDDWGSPRLRLQAYALMLISLWCLLRCDEAVRITYADLEFIAGDTDTPPSFELTLRWRKTDQFGQVKPFRLYMMDAKDPHVHLCPVRAIAAWMLCVSKQEGHLFRKMNSGDRVSDEPLASETFLEWFRNCLVDVGIYPFPYGTHSFRRGGCQFLSAFLRWGPRKIADWGGWSTEFSWVTIVTYLINWSDGEIIERENFLHPGKQPVLLCTVCGRNCGCGAGY